VSNIKVTLGNANNCAIGDGATIVTTSDNPRYHRGGSHVKDDKTIRIQAEVPRDVYHRFEARCYAYGRIPHDKVVELIEGWSNYDDLDADDGPEQPEPVPA